MTTPMAGPWLSPNVVTVNNFPNELPAINDYFMIKCAIAIKTAI